MNNAVWVSISHYIHSCDDIRKNICFQCGKGILRDNNGESYNISWNDTLDQVKELVVKIREINKNKAV